MLANINVSESKPPEDSDSSMSYTMEGFRGQPPSSMIPFFWSPGWNSVQSVNKYQEEVGASLRGGDPGLRLFNPGQNNSVKYFETIPEKFEAVKGKLLAVPLHHIFGSEELSSKSGAVSKRIPKAYVMISKEDASSLQASEGEEIKFEIIGQSYQLPVKISKEIQKGVVGIPIGFADVPYADLPAWAILKT